MQRITIEKLVHGGQSLARLPDGRVVLLNGGLPGETVDAEIQRTKGGLSTAEVITIVTPVPQRRTPRCPYFGRCGGCNWQHMTYPAQVQAKIGIFDECLSRIGKLQTVPDLEVFESPEWNYRCRAQFKLDPHSAKAGFCRRGTNEVITISSCPLLHSSLNELLSAPEQLFRQLPEGTKQLKVIAGDRGLSSHPVLPGRTGEKADIHVDTAIFQISGGGFFQGNHYLHKSLGRWAESYVGGNYFIDLYGGVGYFSVLLGNRFRKGVLIESSRNLVENATENLRANDLDHIKAVRVSAEQFTSRLDLPAQFTPDLVIVDPPRPGLTKKAMENLVSLHPRTILYVSCDPATQARDIAKLVHRHNYRMDRRALFDLYPQTHHLETAVLLQA